MINEPLSAEEQIRAVVREADLGWILTAVDEAIGAGVSEEVGIIDRGRRHDQQAEGLASTSDFREVRIATREKATRTVTKNRPMIGTERLELLLAALGRYLIDVPAIHEGLVEEINAHADPEDPHGIVETIHFQPDEDSIGDSSLHIRVADETWAHPERVALRSKAEELLLNLREEVGT